MPAARPIALRRPAASCWTTSIRWRRSEAALFYGLFLRGHSADSLRRDIDVPRKLLDKLLKRHRNELAVQARLQRAYQYRKQVLAIFDELVIRERIKERVH